MRIVYRLGSIGLIIAVLLAVGCAKAEPKETDLLRMKAIEKSDSVASKKVIVFIADSLMYQSIDRGLMQNQLPTLKYLIEHGQYYRDLVSSFPTMSVTIDTSFLTGTYPDKHGMPGLIWYSEAENRVINYGTGPMEIVRQGIGQISADALIKLNDKHISSEVKTIYEERLAGTNRTTGSINGLIYRGRTEHLLSIPAWIKTPTSLPDPIKVKGPDFLSFGLFSNPLKDAVELPVQITDRFGLSNRYAIEATEYLIRSGSLPDFLYVYLPDLDQKLHKNGPEHMDGVVKLDSQLQSVLQAFGSPEEAMRKAVIMVVGDSGMSRILPKEQNPVIDLTALLKNFRMQKPGAEVTDGTEVILAVNETMAYVYKHRMQQSLGDLADNLKADSRIDHIAWIDGDWIRVERGGSPESFLYRAGGRFRDKYGARWTFGDGASLLDIKVNEAKGTIEYGNYPDALRRLSGALHSHKGQFLVVTAKEGYEFTGGSSPTHIGGGGHGAFNATESLVPLIITGTNKKPDKLRMVDMKGYVMELLNNNR